MNNWRLLLLAVVAVLQPIGSYTERNFIDGRKDCCDPPSNSATQDTRVYGTYRKTISEERRLSSRDDIREERRYEDRNEPITQSRERLSRERGDRRSSPESTFRLTAETRFARDPERRNRLADAKGSRQIRQEHADFVRERLSISQYERDMLDSRRIKMSRDDTRTGRIGNEQMSHREERRLIARDTEDRRVSANRDSMLVRDKKDDVARDAVRRDSKITAFRSVTRLQLDHNRERLSLDRRERQNVDENRRSRSLEPRVNIVNIREEFRSPVDLRDNRRSNFRETSEGIGELRQDQNRESRGRTRITLRDSIESISADQRRESRGPVQRLFRSRSDIKENYNNQRIVEQQQLRDETRLSRERLSTLRDSRLGTAAERSQARIRISDGIVRSEERREAARDQQRVQRSRDTTTERRQDSRGSRQLDATSQDDRIHMSDERRAERRQHFTRSLDRVSVRTTFVRNGKATQYRRNVRSVDQLDERREQRDGNLMSRDGTSTTRRDSSRSFERRPETSRTASLSRFEVISRSKRDSRINNVRVDVNRYDREALRNDHRMARNTEGRHVGPTRTNRVTVRTSSDDQNSRESSDIKSERLDVYQESRESRGANQGPKEITVVAQRLQETFTSSRLQRTSTLTDGRDERRHARKYDGNVVLQRNSITRLSRERIGNDRREVRVTKDSRNDAQNEGISNRGQARMAERLGVRSLRDETRSTDRVSLHRQSRDVRAEATGERRSHRFASDVNRSEIVPSSRDNRRTNERELRSNVRDFRPVDSRRESKITTEREVEPNRRNLSMERIDRRAHHANRDMRIKAKLMSSETVSTRDVRFDNRRNAIDARFRSFEAKIREIEPVDERSNYQNVINWQMVFYTLQGAYLCGLVIQMLTEKPSNGKTRNFTWWAASKNLVKVD